MTDQDRLEDLLVEWEELSDQGCQVDVGELCRESPELKEPLKRRIQALQQLDSFMTDLSAGRTTLSSEVSQTVFDKASLSTSASYRLLRHHASGGKGQVHLAHDETLDRLVAVKLVHPAMASDQETRRRFLREVEMTSRLDHPGIVPIYARGDLDEKHPFFCMRFVSGDTLLDSIREFHEVPGDATKRKLTFRSLLRNVIDCCQVVAYAHKHGVLHCDLKPENILIGEFGETFVVDWGLARSLGSTEPGDQLNSSAAEPSPTMTSDGPVLGTPSYMSPEQASGELSRFTAATDVYNLGAVLYTLLTGRRPFESRSIVSLLAKVRENDFPQPREVKQEIPPALESVCLKAMASKPEDRYTSPRLIADDIERWLADEPVAVHRERLFERAARWARNHQTFVTTAAVTLVTVTIGLVAGTAALGFEQAKTEAERIKAVGARRDADASLLDSLDTLEGVTDRVMSEAMKSHPELQSFRRETLVSARELYTKIADRHADSPLVQSCLFRGNFLDAILQLDGGRHPQALESLARAEAALSKLTEDRPNEFGGELAECRFHVAMTHEYLGNLDDARAAYARAVEAFRESLEINNNAHASIRLARCLLDLARLPASEGEPDRQMDLLLEASELAKQHSDGLVLAEILVAIAGVQSEPDQIAVTLKEASDLLATELIQRGDSWQVRSNIARTLLNVGFSAIDVRDLELTRRSGEKALSICASFLQSENPMIMRLLSKAYKLLAMVSILEEKITEAIDHLNQKREIEEILLARGQWADRKTLASTLQALAMMHERLGDTAKAEKFRLESQQLLTKGGEDRAASGEADQ